MNYLPSSSQCNTDKNYSDTLTSKSEINYIKTKHYLEQMKILTDTIGGKVFLMALIGKSEKKSSSNAQTMDVPNILP